MLVVHSFMADKKQTYNFVFIHSPTGGHLYWFHFLAGGMVLSLCNSGFSACHLKANIWETNVGRKGKIALLKSKNQLLTVDWGSKSFLKGSFRGAQVVGGAMYRIAQLVPTIILKLVTWSDRHRFDCLKSFNLQFQSQFVPLSLKPR